MLLKFTIGDVVSHSLTSMPDCLPERSISFSCFSAISEQRANVFLFADGIYYKENLIFMQLTLWKKVKVLCVIS